MKKTLKVFIAFDIDGNVCGSNHIKTSNAWDKAFTIYEYNIDTENLTVTRRTWIKDIHGQLHEVTGIKPVV